MSRIFREFVLETVWISRFVVRSMLDSVRQNSSWALLAIILSAVLWVIVTGEQNPPKVDVYPSPIPVEVVNVPADLGVLGEVQFVRVRISALPDAWARISAGTFRATADLSGSRPGAQEAGVRVLSSDSQVRVLEVLPPKIPVTVEALDSRLVPVKTNLIGSAPLGVSIGDARTSVVQVTARGPAPLVSQVESAGVDITMDGLRVAINRQSYKLTPRNSSGSRIDGVTLDPATVDVSLSVEQQLSYRSVSVVPSLQGQVADGYWLSAMRVEPVAVTVAGPRDAAEPLSFLNTQPIDVSRLSLDTVRAAVVALPSGLTLMEPRGGSVLVYFSILPIQGSQPFYVTPAASGLGEDVQVTIDPVPIVISGPVPQLRQLKASELIATVDLKGLAPGTHLVPLKLTVPGGLKGEQVPEQVSVSITRG